MRENRSLFFVSQMVWYFIDGVKPPYGLPASVYGMTEYVVDFKEQDYTLSFGKA
ncbi:MAG: hypothetical protein R2784_20895 [Saprospiraceae bacterium]